MNQLQDPSAEIVDELIETLAEQVAQRLYCKRTSGIMTTPPDKPVAWPD
jgi:hypothetical protein